MKKMIMVGLALLATSTAMAQEQRSKECEQKVRNEILSNLSRPYTIAWRRDGTTETATPQNILTSVLAKADDKYEMIATFDVSDDRQNYRIIQIYHVEKEGCEILSEVEEFIVGRWPTVNQ